MPRTPRSARRGAAASAAAGGSSNNGGMARHTPEPRMDQLQDEREHVRVATVQHDALVLEKLDNLRGLVKEIKQDDWKYDAKERLPNHVTKSLAWKQQQTAPSHQS